MKTKTTIPSRVLIIALLTATISPVIWSSDAVEQFIRFNSTGVNTFMRVDGTSTVHDWTVKGPSINGHLKFKVALPPDATTRELREAIIANPQASVDVQIPVTSLKSGKKDMDKKMYEAMKIEQHPAIFYKLMSLKVPEDSTSDQQSYVVQTVGELTVAGATRELRMPMTLRVIDAQNIRISGQISMKMTDFNVKPPQAMMGMIKSGDKIKVNFEWSAVRESGQTTSDR